MNGDYNQKTTGTLYGLGVGPGDPELMPVKATRILQAVDVIYTASSSKNEYSLAVNIARSYIPEHVPIRLLPFPMTQKSTEKEKAWEDNAKTMILELESGRNLAFLTLGDPLTYSTYGYIVKNIYRLAPDLSIETVPGITSYQAAAAAINTPLVEGEENLLLLSGVKGGHGLRSLTQGMDNIVFLKAYRHIDDIDLALKKSDNSFECKAVIRCGFPDQEVVTDLRELSLRKPKYWTLVIAKRK